MRFPALDLPPLYAAQAAAINDPARIVVIEASTKSGKTVGCLLWLLAQAWNSQRGTYWWVAPTYSQSRIAFGRLQDWLRQADSTNRSWTANLSLMQIDLATGAVVAFRSADNADSLYGEDVDAAVIDEASRCTEAAWHAVRSTLTATRGPVRIIGNVRGRKNWAFRLARMAESGAPDTAYYRLSALDAVRGGVMAAAEIDDARRVLPDSVFRELYMAEPSDDGGNPFGIEAIARCVAPLSPDPPAVWGIDLAKSHDWCVALALDAAGKCCRLERWQGDWGTTRARISALIEQAPALIDSTGVGDPIVEDIQRTHRNAQGFRFSAQSKQQIMEGLSSAIHQGAIRFPDGWLRAELEAFEFVYTRTGVRYSAPEGLHDDGVCALALAVEARRAAAAVPRFSFRVI